MKPSGVLINVVPGKLVDEAVLLDVLQSRRIRGAELDAFVHELLELYDTLLQLET